jgi:Methionine biosynthesis protein MetW
VTIDDAPGEVDLGRVQAEIAEEVRHRRATGDFPPGLERELDAMFARYAPAGTGEDFDDVLASAEVQSFVHADVPTESRRAPLALVKRVLRKVMAWYVRFLAQQVTAFAGTITRAVTLLGHRVDALETVAIVADDRALAGVRDRRADPDPASCAEVLVAALAGAPGRVLHTECGTGGLIRALVGAGLDGYGVEPVEELMLEASRSGLDVRVDTALAHLRKVPDDTLGGVVLSGCVDALPIGEVLAIAGRAVAALAPGGALVVLCSGPVAWARSLDPVVADLSPGHPLHAETWTHVLEGAGLSVERVVSVASAGPGPTLAPVPDDTPGAAVLNANIAQLNRVLFAPDAFAVVARKSR